VVRQGAASDRCRAEDQYLARGVTTLEISLETLFVEESTDDAAAGA
jgi:hypothetical protein